MKKVPVLLGVAIVALQMNEVIAVSTPNTRDTTEPTAVKDVTPITFKITLKEGNYSLYEMRDGKLTPVAPMTGKPNVTKKKAIYELTLNVVENEDGNGFRLADGEGMFMLVRLNPVAGSVTLCQMQTWITDKNMLDFCFVESAHPKAFSNENVVVMPALDGTELGRTLTTLCTEVGWTADKLMDISRYDLKKAAKGLIPLSGIVVDFKTTENVATILTLDDFNKLTMKEIKWSNVTDNNDAILAAAIIHTGMEKNEITDVEIFQLAEEAEVTA